MPKARSFGSPDGSCSGRIGAAFSNQCRHFVRVLCLQEILRYAIGKTKPHADAMKTRKDVGEMKAVVVHEAGGPEKLVYQEVPLPEMREGWSLVKVMGLRHQPFGNLLRAREIPLG